MSVIVILVLGCLLISPEHLSQGPDLCLWRHLRVASSCPACGSLRALAAFFHGRVGDALAFNRNVLVTAPTLLALLGIDTLGLLKKILAKCAGLNARLELPRF